MFITDNDIQIARCDICGVNCGMIDHPALCRVMTANIIALEVCANCADKTIKHAQSLMSAEAVQFYRDFYKLDIDPHNQYIGQPAPGEIAP